MSTATPDAIPPSRSASTNPRARPTCFVIAKSSSPWRSASSRNTRALLRTASRSSAYAFAGIRRSWCRATTASRNAGLRRRSTSRNIPLRPPRLAQRDRDRGEQDHALRDHLTGRGEAHEDEPVVEHPHDQAADERADDAAGSAEEPRPPDHDGGDHWQQVLLAERVRRALQPTRIEEAGERGKRS